jgi:hypothetical protein
MDLAEHTLEADLTLPERCVEAGVAAPYGPRLRRAVILLIASIAAHLWLVRAPRLEGPLSRPLLAIASPAMSQSGLPVAPLGAARQSFAELRAARGRSVRVKTEFISVSPAPRPDGGDGGAARDARTLEHPVATTGFVRAARTDTSPLRGPNDGSMDDRLATHALVRPVDDPGRHTISELGIIGDGPAVPMEPAEHIVPAALTSATPISPAFAESTSAPAGLSATDRMAELRKQEDIVRKVLLDYTRAYERLDVQAAKAIWPSVDDRALQHAFEQLDAQQVRFASCGVSVSGRDANARCRGDATYRPKVGSRVLRLTAREWTFSLSRDNDRWQIVNATLQ